MRFDIFFLSQAPEGLSAREALERELGQIELAEELGFECVWLGEHHFTDYCVSNDPLTYAAHIAARTNRIRIGLAVSVLPLHNPVEVAERAALVDVLSGGRLNVGVGRGYSVREFNNFGVPREEREERFQEALDVITRLWTEDRVSHSGRFWQLRDAWLMPRPVQRPHPPLYMATSGSPESLRLAAERRVPIIQGVDFIEPGQVVSVYQRYRELAVAAGRRGAEAEALLEQSAVTQKVFVAPSREEALSAPAPFAMWRHRKVVSLLPPAPPSAVTTKVRHTLRPVRRMFTGNGTKDFAEMTWEDLRGYDLYGSPEDVVRKIERLQDAGARRLICWFAYGGMPDGMVRGAMELFAREVMPRFRREPAAPLSWPGAGVR